MTDRAMRPIYGCPENFRDSLITPTSTFHNFFTAFVLIDPMNVLTLQNLKSVALPVPEIIRGTQKFGQSHLIVSYDDDDDDDDVVVVHWCLEISNIQEYLC